MALPTTAAELRKRHVVAGVDPDLKLPAQIRDQAMRSTAIQHALTGESEPPLINGSTPPAPETPPNPPPEAQAATPQEPPTNPAPAAAPGDEQISPEEWEARYKAMKGRYEATREELGQAAEQIGTLRSQLNGMAVASPQVPISTMPLLSEQEIAEYGPDFIDVVRRVATEIAAPLNHEINALRGQLGTVQQEAGNSFLTRMHATIGAMVPNWQELNRDPRFIAWVQLPDVFSGAIRQELMQEAWNNGDAQRVCAFFRGFLAEEAAVDPAGSQARGYQAPPAPLQPSPLATPVGGVVPLSGRLSLDALAAPGRAHSVAQQPADKPVYTAAEITRFYTEVAAGKWRTRDADRAAIDADIIAAQREGRIIPDQRTMIHMGDVRGNR